MIDVQYDLSTLVRHIRHEAHVMSWAAGARHARCVITECLLRTMAELQLRHVYLQVVMTCSSLFYLLSPVYEAQIGQGARKFLVVSHSFRFQPICIPRVLHKRLCIYIIMRARLNLVQYLP